MRRRIVAVIVTLMLIGVLPGTSEVHAQALADYTASPPFTTTAIPPNILLLLDNSGSMNTRAYETAFDASKAYYGLFDPYECYDYGSNKFQPDPATNPTTLGTCSNGTYLWSGNLLNYATMRRIDIVKWVMMGGICSVGGRDAQGNCRQLIGQSSFDSCCQDQTGSVTVAQASGRMPTVNIPSSGNVYFHMMGSTNSLKGSVCVDDDNTQPSGADCSDSDGYAESNWQIRVDLFENASGIIQQVGSKARFGLMEFKGSGDGGKVLSDIGGSVTSMITAIESTTPSTSTPLAESLYEGTRYFAQVAPAYTNSDYSYNVTSRDPYYFQQPDWASTSQYVNCCKSFVIIFTDGEPTNDLNVPAGIQDYAHAVHGTHCTGVGCNGHQTDYSNSGSHYLDDVAYFAHTNDLRQTTIPVLNEAGKDLSGSQNLTVYTFFAFGSGSEILKAAAKAGGFDDRNGNNLPDQTAEWDKVNNNTGAAGADGVPDTYFESADADKLQERLLAAITSILQRSASGTSVSVLATSSTGDGSLYQAYFYPLQYEGLNSVAWTGYTQGLFIDEFGNVREDTDGDGKLIYQNDIIIRTRFDSNTGDVLVDRFVDSDGDGKANGPAIPVTVGLKEIKPIWEAGRRLALTSPSARTILTWVDANNNGIVDAGEQIPFTTANSMTLAPYLRAGAAPYTADNIVNFIRGSQVTGLRDRQLTVTDDAGASALQVWKMGDPINATPTVVGAPKERFDVIYGDASYTAFFQQYKSRRQVAYVGANDGMLHAFNGGFYHKGDDSVTTGATEHGYFTRTAADNSSGALLGQELWGFIPYQLLPHLQWLTQSGYTHVYYVDLKPKVTDVRIFTPDADHPNGWGTILIGGMRMGGSCGACVSGTGAPPMTVTADFGSGVQTRTFYTAYFVLDITNPEKSPVLLWSFTDSTLGLSTSYPTVLRVKPSCSTSGCKVDNSDAKWFMLVGSGPTGYGGNSTQTGKIFVIDLQTGPKDPATGASLVSSFPTSDPNSFMGDAVALDADLDFRVDAAYLGNVINNGSNPSWAGKLYRLTTGSTFPFGVTVGPSAWGIVSGANRAPTVLLATFPTGGSTLVGPITAAPTVTADDANRLWVFFGTGRFYGTSDKTNTDTQYFFGVKDPVVTNGCTQSSVASCQQNNLLNVSAVTVCTVCAGGANQVSGVAGVTTFSGTATTTLEGMVQSLDGWYTTLPTSGERSLSPPVILGGTVFFTTFTPSSDICSSGGTGNVYALFYKTGSANKEPVIGTYTGTGGGASNAACASGSTCVSRAIGLGAGLPSQMAVQIGAQGTGSSGTASGAGCTGRATLISQASTGAMNQLCSKPALSSWSRYVSWINQRD